MKYNYVYEIVWEYVQDDCESHRTLIEVSSNSEACAIRRFRKYFKYVHAFSSPKYDVISVSFLGKVLKI